MPVTIWHRFRTDNAEDIRAEGFASRSFGRVFFSRIGETEWDAWGVPYAVTLDMTMDELREYQSITILDEPFDATLGRHVPTSDITRIYHAVSYVIPVELVNATLLRIEPDLEAERRVIIPPEAAARIFYTASSPPGPRPA